MKRFAAVAAILFVAGAVLAPRSRRRNIASTHPPIRFEIGLVECAAAPSRSRLVPRDSRFDERSCAASGGTNNSVLGLSRRRA
jgi:hypothetical protein